MANRADLTAAEVETLRENLARRVEGEASVPTLPEVAVKILELVGDRDAGLRDFADVIQTDQALTGKLLKLSNSAFFAQAKPVTNLNRALVLLGIERLKAIALGFKLASAMGAEGEHAKRQWSVALFRAWLAMRVTELVDTQSSGEAFIIGLLLDVGEWYMPQLVGDAYGEHVDPDAAPRDRFVAEIEHLQFTHVDVASAIARAWKFPVSISGPIVDHHAPALPLNEGGDLLRAVTSFVGQIAIDPRESADLSVGAARVAERTLGVPVQDIVSCAQTARVDFDATAQVFKEVLSSELGSSDIQSRAHDALSGAAESLIAMDVERDGEEAPGVVINAGSLQYTLHPAPIPGSVLVFIADADGQKIVSEMVDPKEHTPDKLRAHLLAERAPDAEFAALSDGILRIAA